MSERLKSPGQPNRQRKPRVPKTIVIAAPPPVKSAKYHALNLLTPTEKQFYQELMEAMPRKYAIWAKVRIADLVTPTETYRSREWLYDFNRIKAKHVDFVVIRVEDCKVMRLIELDDDTHLRASRIRRDEFVDQILWEAGFKLIRVRADEASRKLFIDTLRPDQATESPGRLAS